MHCFADTPAAGFPGRPAEQSTDHLGDPALYRYLLPPCLLADPGLFIPEKKAGLWAGCDYGNLRRRIIVRIEHLYGKASRHALLPWSSPEHFSGSLLYASQRQPGRFPTEFPVGKRSERERDGAFADRTFLFESTGQPSFYAQCPQ